jgi:hypothetical protein
MAQTVRWSAIFAALALLGGCGGAPSEGAPAAPEASWNLRLQEFQFTGVVEPGAGRVQLIAAPQAALQPIPEDANGNALSATNATLQVYGSLVEFPARGAANYPAACNVGAPSAMISNVEVRSGFTEQLRNVYARIDAVSGSQTFCSKASPGAFANELGPYVGLYLYQPLDPVSGTNRTQQWALNLPTNAPYWFSGKVLAEVIPQPTTITSPTTGQVFTTAAANYAVPFAWTKDPLATGTNPEGFSANRPLLRNQSVRLVIYRCAAAVAGDTFNPASCTTAVSTTTPRGTSVNVSLARGYWYQAVFNTRFTIPPNTTTQNGSLTTTQYFKVTN